MKNRPKIKAAWDKYQKSLDKVKKLLIKSKAIQDKAFKIDAECGDRDGAKVFKARNKGELLRCDAYVIDMGADRLILEAENLYCDAVIAKYGPLADVNWTTGRIELKE